MTRKQFKKTYYTGNQFVSKTHMKHLRKDTFVTFSDGCSGGGFSKQKLKYGVLSSNPTLNKFPHINLKKGSKIFTVTDSGEYHNVQGHFYDPPLWTDEAIIKAIDKVKFWVIRAGVCIKLGDYESALNRMERALTAFDLIKVAQVYGVNVD